MNKRPSKMVDFTMPLANVDAWLRTPSNRFARSQPPVHPGYSVFLENYRI